jgi:hypothetical protein
VSKPKGGLSRFRFGVAAVAVLALVAGLVCGRSGGGGGGPADGAARLVPATALLYVHASTDPAREQDRRLVAQANALPPLRRLRQRFTAALSPRAFDLARDVRPWLGNEIAYAALSAADSVVLAAVADRPKAEALVARIGNLSAAERYRGVRVLRAGPTALAFAGGFLAVGTEPAVRAAIDRAQGKGARLADVPGYKRLSAGSPAARSLDAYASAAGVRLVLAPRRGLLGIAGRLLDRPRLTAAGADLTSEPGGLRAHVRLAGGAPRGATFEPVLLERVSETTAAYLGVRGAGRLVALLDELGAGSALESTRTTVGDEAGVDLDRDVLAPLSGEVALAVNGGGAGGAPVVTLKAQTADARRTEGALARLQESVAARLALPGTAPGFRPQTIGGLPAFTLRVTPELAPTYAVADGRLIVSTAPAGLLPPSGTLAASAAFRSTIGQVPDTADSLILIDLRQLLALGEQTGLTAIPGFATARDDLRRVRAAGAVVTEDPAHPSDTNAELFLEIL